jgi:hypothetical protein
MKELVHSREISIRTYDPGLERTKMSLRRGHKKYRQYLLSLEGERPPHQESPAVLGFQEARGLAE